MSCQDFGMSLVDDESIEDDYPYVPGIGTGTRGFISNLNRANFSIGSPPTGCSPDEVSCLLLTLVLRSRVRTFRFNLNKLFY